MSEQARLATADGGETAPADGAREITPAACRALAEAEERRRQAASQPSQSPTELGGQAGPDPTRYGDWEKAGIVSDF